MIAGLFVSGSIRHPVEERVLGALETGARLGPVVTLLWFNTMIMAVAAVYFAWFAYVIVVAPAPAQAFRRTPLLFACAIAALVVGPESLARLTAAARGADNAAAIAAIGREFQTASRAVLDRHHAAEVQLSEGQPFSSPALARPDGMREARERLAELRVLDDRSRAATEALAARARAKLSALPMDQRHKSRLLATVDARFAQGPTNWDPRTEFLDALEAELDVLSRQPRSWTIHNGGVRFANERDRADFELEATRVAAARVRIADLYRTNPRLAAQPAPR